MSSPFQLERPKFIEQVNHFVHPSEEVSDPIQLKGRDIALSQLRDAFETNGMNAFIWGLRGVGKTSLVHTACVKFSSQVRLAAAISCSKTTTANELLNDIFSRVMRHNKFPIRSKESKASLSAFGISFEGNQPTLKDSLDIKSINQASDFLNTILPTDFENRREWVIIIDEFDLLKNEETIDFFTTLAKQISVDKVSVKFVFCGVASNLNDLIGSHDSVERYLKAIELKPLIAESIMDITDFIGGNFQINLNRGQKLRIAQISCGYPHFAHLIMREILNTVYELGHTDNVSAEVFKIAVQKAAQGAETRFKSSYDAATKKGTDRYIEVLWAAADGQLLQKQFKDISRDYGRIIAGRNNRTSLEDDTQLRNHLNGLAEKAHGSVLIRSKNGWYSFADPMFRSYVRMVAHVEGVDLGDESFQN